MNNRETVLEKAVGWDSCETRYFGYVSVSFVLVNKTHVRVQ
jgi:hypothetical protein